MIGLAVPSVAQTRFESHQTDRSPSISIDLATVGGGALGLIAASVIGPQCLVRFKC